MSFMHNRHANYTKNDQFHAVDGLIYLPEIKYRRILNKAFGPGAWGLAPRGDVQTANKIVSREYALVCQGRCVALRYPQTRPLNFGRLVAIAKGEQQYFDDSGIPTATEACKSNALMRCCKDLGIASELWCVAPRPVLMVVRLTAT